MSMTERPTGRQRDPEERRDIGNDDDLPPGVHDDRDNIPGEVREARPYDDAPGDGKFAPDADNPPPPGDGSSR